MAASITSLKNIEDKYKGHFQLPEHLSERETHLLGQLGGGSSHVDGVVRGLFWVAHPAVPNCTAGKKGRSVSRPPSVMREISHYLSSNKEISCIKSRCLAHHVSRIAAPVNIDPSFLEQPNEISRRQNNGKSFERNFGPRYTELLLVPSSTGTVFLKPSSSYLDLLPLFPP